MIMDLRNPLKQLKNLFRFLLPEWFADAGSRLSQTYLSTFGCSNDLVDGVPFLTVEPHFTENVNGVDNRNVQRIVLL